MASFNCNLQTIQISSSAFNTSAHCFQDTFLYFFTIKMKDKIKEYNIRNCAVRLQISKHINGKYKKLSTSVSTLFSQALTVWVLLTSPIFGIENVGQSHAVQHSQWCHSIANIRIYKHHFRLFYSSSNRFRDIIFSNFFTLNMKNLVTKFNIHDDALTLTGPLKLSKVKCIYVNRMLIH